MMGSGMYFLLVFCVGLYGGRVGGGVRAGFVSIQFWQIAEGIKRLNRSWER
jgi:hypothetical protein